jgi:hypothetical protein
LTNQDPEVGWRRRKATAPSHFWVLVQDMSVKTLRAYSKLEIRGNVLETLHFYANFYSELKASFSPSIMN